MDWKDDLSVGSMTVKYSYFSKVNRMGPLHGNKL